MDIVKKESKIGYMCAVDYAFELDECNLHGAEVYSSLEALKEKRKCTNTCGIVKVSVVLEEVVQKENYRGENNGN
jgi:hypothetical protein